MLSDNYIFVTKIQMEDSMKKSIIKLVMALSMVLTMVGCEITVVEAYSLNYNYAYTAYCEPTDENCEDQDASSYVRVTGDLVEGARVTIEAYLPGDDHPYLNEDFYYNGRKSDALGTFDYFVSASNNPKTYFSVYDGDYAVFEEAYGAWSYSFSNDPDLYKKNAKK